MPEISDDMLDRVDRIPTKDYITLSERISYPAIYYAFDVLPEDVAEKMGFHVASAHGVDGIDFFVDDLIHFFEEIQPVLEDFKQSHSRLVITSDDETDDAVLLQRAAVHAKTFVQAFPFFQHFLEVT